MNRVALKKCCDNLNLSIIKIIIAILVSILGQLFITRATRVPFFRWSSTSAIPSKILSKKRWNSEEKKEGHVVPHRKLEICIGRIRFDRFTPTKENEIEREGKKENKENIRIIERIITLNRQSLPRDCIPR